MRRTALRRALSHYAPTTRDRLAAKIAERYLRHPASPHLLELVRRVRDESTLKEMLLLHLAQVDTLVMALAEEVLFPYLIEGKTPKGYTEDGFRLINTSRLLDEKPMICAYAAHHYARRTWSLNSLPTVRRALRILDEAAVTDSVVVGVGHRRLHGHFPSGKTATAPGWAYALSFFAEYGAKRPPKDAGDFARCRAATLLLQNRVQVEQASQHAHAAGYITMKAGRIKIPSFAAVVTRILTSTR